MNLPTQGDQESTKPWWTKLVDWLIQQGSSTVLLSLVLIGLYQLVHQAVPVVLTEVNTKFDRLVNNFQQQIESIETRQHADLDRLAKSISDQSKSISDQTQSIRDLATELRADRQARVAKQ